MSLLEASGLTKRFGGLVALRDLGFSVEQGQIFGVIGPNGAGKTTLFNLISGLIAPTHGSIIFQGRSLGGLPPEAICRLGISRTFQLVRTFQSLSALENVMVGAEFGRADGPGRVEEALELLGRLGLAAKRDTVVQDLTLVERKRVEVARALATRPRLLLLDEVAAGLTPTETAAMMATVRRVREEGTTVLLIEHNVPAVMGVCDRVMVLHHGQKIAEGPPARVAAEPVVIDAYLGA